MLQLGSCIIGGEMPVYAFLSNVSFNSPRIKKTLKRRKIRNSVICNALTAKSR